MEGIETVHWFLREDCNIIPRCAYCFAPQDDIIKALSTRDEKIAKQLVDNKIKKVVKTGGEPLLARSLINTSEILKNGGAEVSIHTNGMLLNEKLLKSLSGFVDTIAIPIDAVSDDIQRSLRGKAFTEMVSKRLPYWINLIHDQGIKVSLHTVFTSLNDREISKIYQLIKKEPFDNWSVFEFNPDSGANEASLISGYEGSSRLAGTDGFMADFFLNEEKITTKYQDPRIHFIARHDRLPYYFLRPDRSVWFYPSHLSERVCLGNLSEGLPSLAQRSQQIILNTSAEFFDSEGDFPLWRRIYEGNYFEEEIEAVDGRCAPRIQHLIDWLQKRDTYISE